MSSAVSAPEDLARSLTGRARTAVAAQDAPALASLADAVLPHARAPEFAGLITYLYSAFTRLGLVEARDDFAMRLIENETCAASIYISAIQEGEKALKANSGGVAVFAERLRSHVRLLQTAIRLLPAEERQKRQIAQRAAQTLLSLGADDEVLELVRGLEAGETADGGAELSRLSEIVRACATPDAYTVICDLRRRFPADLRIASAYANLLMKFRGPADEIRTILEAAVRSEPDNLARWRWLAIHLFETQDWDRAETVAGHVARRGRTEEERLRAATVLIRRGKAGRAKAYLQSLPARGDDRAFGAFAPLLRDLLAIVGRNIRFEDEVDIGQLQDRLAGSAGALRKALEGRSDAGPQEMLRASASLASIAHAPFSHFADKTEQFDFRWADDEGTFDVYANKAIFASLLEHAGVFVEHALSDQALGGRIEPRSIVRDLAQQCVSVFVQLGTPARARAKLDWLIERGFDGYLFKQLRETCALEDGSAFEGAGLAGLLQKPGTALHRTLEFDAWCAREHIRPAILLQEPEIASVFELVRGDRVLREGHYTLPSLTLYGARLTQGAIRDSELVFGQSGTLLGPHIWHCRRRYPTPGPMVVSQGRRGARLSDPAGPTRIDEPVVVLGNNDCARLANYFHWTILILTRLHFLAQESFLEDRRVLMPEEMTGWMRETLGLAGIREDRIRTYGRSEDLAIADGLLISPIQTPSRGLLRSLRSTMWQSAGVDPEAGRGDLKLFMMRRDQVRRMVMPAEEICDAAQGAGYRLIAPEELTVAEQVRLFAGARVISGPVGASFTNMLFCRDGTKVLPLMKEEAYYPSFNDLAIGLGLRFRWCLGATEDNWLARGDELIHSPYVMDIDLLAEQLAWGAQD